MQNEAVTNGKRVFDGLQIVTNTWISIQRPHPRELPLTAAIGRGPSSYLLVGRERLDITSCSPTNDFNKFWTEMENGADVHFPHHPIDEATVPSGTLGVAFQGERGAYSEQAASQFFTARDQPVQFHPCASFKQMFDALDQGIVERAAVPIENSLVGTICGNLDLFLRYKDLFIVGELDFRVRHCLIAMKGVNLSDVHVVRSHHMALDQCSGYLQAHSLTAEVAYDTAGSAKLIKKKEAMNVAAIAGRRAAEIYDLQILDENIEDDSENYTRFLILARQEAPFIPDTPSKTSIVFTLNDGPGSLYRALSAFVVTEINLSKIESRPLHTVREVLRGSSELFDEDEVETRWGYVFFVDIARHAEEPAVKTALDLLRQITPFFKILGAYPQHVRNWHD